MPDTDLMYIREDERGEIRLASVGDHMDGQHDIRMGPTDLENMLVDRLVECRKQLAALEQENERLRERIDRIIANNIQEEQWE